MCQLNPIVPLRIAFVCVCFFWMPLLKGQGHYNGGSFNTNDYFVPPAPGWVFSMYYSYSSMNFFNGSGKKADVIEVSQTPPLYITIGQKVKTHSAIPMALYFGKGKILNANWGMLALPMLNNPNASIALDFYTTQTSSSSNTLNLNSFGLGDFYLQPIWLTWTKKQLSYTFSYGAWLPIGKYKPNDSKNVGLGYLSHNFRAAGRYQTKTRFGFTSALTLELNHKQKGADFTEAPHLTLDYGASYSFHMGHELGLFGFFTGQAGSDKGSKAIPNKDRIGGLGLYGSYWFVPGKFSVLARYSTAMGVRNRFGGPAFQIGLNYLLMKAPGQ